MTERRTSTLGAAAIAVALLASGVPSVTAAQSSTQTLTRRIDARLDTPPSDRTLWGVAVVDDSGRLIYGRNERKLFVPASNLKLVVSAVASALLPPDWTVRTILYA